MAAAPIAIYAAPVEAVEFEEVSVVPALTTMFLVSLALATEASAEVLAAVASPDFKASMTF